MRAGRWKIKKRYYLIVLAVLAFALFYPRAKPDQVAVIKSPVEGVFYTIETFYGNGPVDSDYTSVYAHLDRGDHSDKKLVLDGEYLKISGITWQGGHDAAICLKGGFTNTFRNEIVLMAGNSSEAFHNHLQEKCDSAN